MAMENSCIFSLQYCILYMIVFWAFPSLPPHSPTFYWVDPLLVIIWTLSPAIKMDLYRRHLRLAWFSGVTVSFFFQWLTLIPTFHVLCAFFLLIHIGVNIVSTVPNWIWVFYNKNSICASWYNNIMPQNSGLATNS